MTQDMSAALRPKEMRKYTQHCMQRCKSMQTFTGQIAPKRPKKKKQLKKMSIFLSKNFTSKYVT